MSEKSSGGGAAAIHRMEARPEPAEGGLPQSRKMNGKRRDRFPLRKTARPQNPEGAQRSSNKKRIRFFLNFFDGRKAVF